MGVTHDIKEAAASMRKGAQAPGFMYYRGYEDKDSWKNHLATAKQIAKSVARMPVSAAGAISGAMMAAYNKGKMKMLPSRIVSTVMGGNPVTSALMATSDLAGMYNRKFTPVHKFNSKFESITAPENGDPMPDMGWKDYVTTGAKTGWNEAGRVYSDLANTGVGVLGDIGIVGDNTINASGRWNDGKILESMQRAGISMPDFMPKDPKTGLLVPTGKPEYEDYDRFIRWARNGQDVGRIAFDLALARAGSKAVNAVSAEGAAALGRGARTAKALSVAGNAAMATPYAKRHVVPKVRKSLATWKEIRDLDAQIAEAEKRRRQGGVSDFMHNMPSWQRALAGGGIGAIGGSLLGRLFGRRMAIWLGLLGALLGGGIGGLYNGPENR